MLIYWHILCSHDKEHLFYVDLEPAPRIVCYDMYVYLIAISKYPAEMIVTYCFENEQYLLFTQILDEHFPKEYVSI